MAATASVWPLLLIGLVFHLVYIGTVFDCYFTSPVVHGMQQHSLESGQAKRLVLIVGASYALRSRALVVTVRAKGMACGQTCYSRRMAFI